MKIIGNVLINTGGHCMVAELLIESGGELRSITVTNECIVGRRVPFSEDDGCIDHNELILWEVHGDFDYSVIPIDIRMEVLQTYFRQRCRD
ncbi:hypothetical protein [Paenibacillus sp. MMO-58]|uniref:hypothetical protein n=1 Tax=Paenibacillus sp. MMO-58 TaxID=3081290 RepID=UPI00301AB919